MSERCPCGSEQAYCACCGPLHRGDGEAASAAQLMRSRYTAFVCGDEEYLRRTWQGQRCPSTLGDLDATQWLGLRLLDCPEEQGDNAEVEFVAFYLQGARVVQLHERSRFVREQGRWHYADGEMLAAVKLSRNDPCCCGSGQKQKKCHPEY